MLCMYSKRMEGLPAAGTESVEPVDNSFGGPGKEFTGGPLTISPSSL